MGTDRASDRPERARDGSRVENQGNAPHASPSAASLGVDDVSNRQEGMA